ncbi:hypothetical protein [Helicobacter sp. 13S00477-4]|uniref:hypothetical protein n=1 Tax=Helicobacter sp. 13S00477-4 TaxID=1905759 RepID=UPI000BA4F687|nr:hypothetical protein [Helicobacter sp. 13S00477-4]PAF52325.1 hypothetical protein BKH44_03190 [Helicobacter sp. 13S00477-4]
MIAFKKKNQIIFASTDDSIFLDSNLKPTKPSSYDIKISCLDSSSLIKHQIHIQNNSFLPPNIKILDWLYSKCLENGVLNIDTSYSLVYLLEDKTTEQIFHIYAYPTTELKSNQILIPDIFLPMSLENEMLQSSLFLFGKNLAFYHNGRLLHHTICQNPQSILQTLDYIQTIHSVIPHIIYTDSELNISLPITICPLNELTHNQQPIASLAFLYFSKSQTNSLPLLKPQSNFCITKSISFKMFLKIACCAILMLIYPMYEVIYSIHLKNKTKILAQKNLEVLESINTLKQNLSNQTNTKNTYPQKFQTLYEIQNSYKSRYNLIALLANEIEDKEILIEDLYLVSDIAQNSLALSIKVLSKTQKNIIDFLNDIKNLNITDHQQIFNTSISQENPSSEIVWISNVE